METYLQRYVFTSSCIISENVTNYMYIPKIFVVSNERRIEQSFIDIIYSTIKCIKHSRMNWKQCFAKRFCFDFLSVDFYYLMFVVRFLDRTRKTSVRTWWAINIIFPKYHYYKCDYIKALGDFSINITSGHKR